MSKSDYIFKKNGNKLEFVGDFDGLYKSEKDPWYQSNETSGEYNLYYIYSRDRLNNKLKEINPNSLLEVGCGLGYTTQIIQDCLPKCDITGMDISSVAVKRADKLFPNLKFKSSDISDVNLSLDIKYDVVVLNQLLWYILKSISDTFENCFSILNTNGRVVISQAFLTTPQLYAKDICDGYGGLISYLNKNMKNKFVIEYKNIDYSNHLKHNDGLIVLRKK